MKVLILFAAVIACSQAVSLVAFLNSKKWIEFKVKFSKKYNKNVAEEKSRAKTYLENEKMIADHNAKYKKGLVSKELALNQFADMSSDEFLSLYAGSEPLEQLELSDENFEVPSGPSAPKTVNSPSQSSSKFVSINARFKRSILSKLRNAFPKVVPGSNVPKTFDWRKKGAVTKVKDQGKCGSCWAFSATGAIEGQHFRKHRKLVTLSEQNLIDCSSRHGNNKCAGGHAIKAFRYIRDNKGINTEESYPYKGRNRTCHFKREKVGSTITGFKILAEGDEEGLKAAVASIGPISVSIDARGIQFYKGGVYRQPANITNIELNHGVLVVGYGKEKKGGKYWLVKNSWGSQWGEKGYIKIARDEHNQCGIASIASYPLM